MPEHEGIEMNMNVMTGADIRTVEIIRHVLMVAQYAMNVCILRLQDLLWQSMSIYVEVMDLT